MVTWPDVDDLTHLPSLHQALRYPPSRSKALLGLRVCRHGSQEIHGHRWECGRWLERFDGQGKLPW